MFFIHIPPPLALGRSHLLNFQDKRIQDAGVDIATGGANVTFRCRGQPATACKFDVSQMFVGYFSREAEGGGRGAHAGRRMNSSFLAVVFRRWTISPQSREGGGGFGRGLTTLAERGNMRRVFIMLG